MSINYNKKGTEYGLFNNFKEDKKNSIQIRLVERWPVYGALEAETER